MSFFETTPTGRIVNRFSSDMDDLDVSLAVHVNHSLIIVLQIISTFAVIVFATPIFAVVIIPTVIIYICVQKFYVATQRQLKRHESSTRSPIFSHFTETLNGASTIRAFELVDNFITASDNKIDSNVRCTWTMMVLNRWLGVILSFISNTLIFFAGFFAILSRETLNPGYTGLAITYAMSISSYLNWFVQIATLVETKIVCVERVLEYTKVESEAEWNIESTKPPPDWPMEGAVEFQDFSTRYRKGLDLILHDVNFKIDPCEKIGVVGRTGAGKSTITLSLLRIIEATEGKILIDGIDISKIGLHDLRNRITIIPQDPVLFSETLRFNLDPFREKTDEEIWTSLEHAHLKDFVKGLDKELDYEVSEGGGNLSVGQRQLICMARALLRKTKLLILDEATAAIDLETDSLIQKTIRSEFSDCTILTIAHRLHTILDSSRVLVLDTGKVIEFDKPQVLLENPNSIFHSLAKDAGIL
jgi:ABC-type multidrug transport system fused ATPase/permease subunit